MNANDARHIVTLYTYEYTGCDYCTAQVSDRFEERVNHYLQDHGCTLLHAGSMTTHDGEGRPWHGAIAILGSDQVPAPRRAPEVVVVPYSPDRPSED